MKVYFATHSTSEDNEVSIASGWKDVRLSLLGTEQARELGTRFENIGLDLICCSDLVRAVQTVKIAFDDQIIVNIDKRLREINYGDLNGEPTEVVDPTNEKWIKKPFPNGESYEQAIARIHEFCKELKTLHKHNVTLIVGHRATKYGLDTLAYNVTFEECLNVKHWWQPYWEYEI